MAVGDRALVFQPPCVPRARTQSKAVHPDLTDRTGEAGPKAMVTRGGGARRPLEWARGRFLFWFAAGPDFFSWKPSSTDFLQNLLCGGVVSAKLGLEGGEQGFVQISLGRGWSEASRAGG
jgi:hypothetical protein